MNELKNLQATGLTNLGAALKQAFDLLNLYRLQSGIDNYGMVGCHSNCKLDSIKGLISWYSYICMLGSIDLIKVVFPSLEWGSGDY